MLMPELLNTASSSSQMSVTKRKINIISHAERVLIIISGKMNFPCFSTCSMPWRLTCMTCHSAYLLYHLKLSTGGWVTPHCFVSSAWGGNVPHLHGPLWLPCILSIPVNIISSLNSPMIPILRVPSAACQYPDSLLQYYINDRRTTLHLHFDSQEIYTS